VLGGLRGQRQLQAVGGDDNAAGAVLGDLDAIARCRLSGSQGLSAPSFRGCAFGFAISYASPRTHPLMRMIFNSKADIYSCCLICKRLATTECRSLMKIRHSANFRTAHKLR